VKLLDRLATRADGSSLHAGSLVPTDLDSLLLDLRKTVLGNAIVSHSRCLTPDCDTQIEVSFTIDHYLAHRRPSRPSNVREVPGQPEWYSVIDSEAIFRLITVDDLLAVGQNPNLEKALATRAIRPERLSARDLRRVQRAMESMAPSLSQEIEGCCPACGATSRFFFHVRRYILPELRYEAEMLYEDVNLLAQSYHWPEEKILALPRTRRLQYAELALRGSA
jgi:hypothetical protein